MFPPVLDFLIVYSRKVPLFITPIDNVIHSFYKLLRFLTAPFSPRFVSIYGSDVEEALEGIKGNERREKKLWEKDYD